MAPCSQAEIEDEVVDRLGGHAGLDQVVERVQAFGRKPAGAAHALEVLRRRK